MVSLALKIIGVILLVVIIIIIILFATKTINLGHMNPTTPTSNQNPTIIKPNISGTSPESINTGLSPLVIGLIIGLILFIIIIIIAVIIIKYKRYDQDYVKNMTNQSNMNPDNENKFKHIEELKQLFELYFINDTNSNRKEAIQTIKNNFEKYPEYTLDKQLYNLLNSIKEGNKNFNTLLEEEHKLLNYIIGNTNYSLKGKFNTLLEENPKLIYPKLIREHLFNENIFTIYTNTFMNDYKSYFIKFINKYIYTFNIDDNDKSEFETIYNNNMDYNPDSNFTKLLKLLYDYIKIKNKEKEENKETMLKLFVTIPSLQIFIENINKFIDIYNGNDKYTNKLPTFTNINIIKNNLYIPCYDYYIRHKIPFNQIYDDLKNNYIYDEAVNTIYDVLKLNIYDDNGNISKDKISKLDIDPAAKKYIDTLFSSNVQTSTFGSSKREKNRPTKKQTELPKQQTSKKQTEPKKHTEPKKQTSKKQICKKIIKSIKNK